MREFAENDVSPLMPLEGLEGFVPDESQELPAELESPNPEPTSPHFNYWQLPGENTKMYEYLGIKGFKKWVVPNGDLMRKHVWSRLGVQPLGLPPGDNLEQVLKREVIQTKVIEVAHLGMAAIMGYAAGSSLGSEVAIQTVANVYPIMLQRYNRLRAVKLLDRLQQRNS